MTRAFLPSLKLAASSSQGPARVVFVASFYAGQLDLSDSQFKRRKYDPDSAYQASKQADRMLAVRWADQLKDANIIVSSCHPGVATSNVSLGLGFDIDRSVTAQKKGAVTPIFCAVSPKVQSGKYYSDSAEVHCEFAGDREKINALWELCEAAAMQ